MYHDFISRNKPDWDELERLVARARKSIRRMTPDELSRLDVLYRRTTVHLAQVATRTSDARLARYLNDLTAAAHSLIYLPPKQPVWKGALKFAAAGFSRAVVRNGRCHATSPCCFSAARLWRTSLQSAIPWRPMPCCRRRKLACRVPRASSSMRCSAHGREQGSGQKFWFASFLFSHNLKVGILAMGTGVLAAVPTVLLLVYNGMMLGAFTAVHHQAGIYGEYWAWVLPHGVTEIGAIILWRGCRTLAGSRGG